MMIVFIDFSEVFLGMGEHGSRELYEVHSLHLSLPSMFKGGVIVYSSFFNPPSISGLGAVALPNSSNL